MKSFDIPNALDDSLEIVGKMVDARKLRDSMELSTRRLLLVLAELFFASWIILSCFSLSNSLSSPGAPPIFGNNITTVMNALRDRDYNISLNFSGLTVLPMMSWKLLSSEATFAPSFENLSRLKRSLSLSCSSCNISLSRLDACGDPVNQSNRVETFEMFIPDIRSAWLPPIPVLREERVGVLAADSLMELPVLTSGNFSCLSRLDILFISDLNETIRIDLISVEYLSELVINNYSLKAISGLLPDTTGILNVFLAFSATLFILLFWFLKVPVSFLTHLFTVNLLACTGFRFYMGVSGIYTNLLIELSSKPPVPERIEAFICWLQWGAVVQWIQVFTILMYLLRIFTFSRNLIVFLQVFAILFFGTALLGSLAIGDAGLVSTVSFADFSLMQFQMISSQWPDVAFWDPARHTRPLLFSVYALVNGLILFCVLYSFYQAVIGSDFSRKIWISSGWRSTLSLGVRDRLRLLHKLSQVTPPQISDVTLCKIAGPAVFKKLENAGLIQYATAHPKMIVSENNTITDASSNREFFKMINGSIKLVRVLKAPNTSPKIKKESTILEISDEVLKMAVEKSFESGL